MREFAFLGGGMAVLICMTYAIGTGGVPRQAREFLGLPSFGPQKPSPAAETAKSAAKTSDKRTSGARKKQTEPIETEIQVVSWRPLPEIPDPPQGMRTAFPEPRNFASGMLRSDIERLYGRPTLSTVQTRSGRLLQRYIYVSPEKSSTTMAIMEDGRVVSALSLPN
jgi:hypothetical protein